MRGRTVGAVLAVSLLLAVLQCSHGEYGPMTVLEARAFTSLVSGSLMPAFMITSLMSLGPPQADTCLCRTDYPPRGAANKLLARVSLHPTSPLRYPVGACASRSFSSLSIHDLSALGHSLHEHTLSPPRCTRGGGGGGMSPLLHKPTLPRPRSATPVPPRDVSLSMSDTASGGKGEAVQEELAVGELGRDDIGYQPISGRDRLLSVSLGLAASLLPRVFDLVARRGSASVARGAGHALLALAIGTASAWLAIRELRQKGRLVSEQEARYNDSKFVAAGGIDVHYIESGGEAEGGKKPRATLVCLHGFGASCVSYRGAMKRLAEDLDARIIAVDMPGFGLTSRPKGNLKAFDMEKVLPKFIDALGLGKDEPLVVVGHSLGGLVCANYLAQKDAKACAAVLVSPAVVPSANPKPHPQPKEGGEGALFKAKAVVRAMARIALACASAAGIYLFQLILRLLSPLVIFLLRQTVYKRSFWESGLGAAYYDKSKLTEETLMGYRRASRVKGWDRGLLRFATFRVTGGLGLVGLLKRAVGSATHQAGPSLSERLAQGGKPIMLLHGEGDRVIPAANSKRLSELTGGTFAPIPKCGHNPMEECVDEFVQEITGFVRERVFA